VHNEEKVVEFKMKNLCNLDYQEDKTRIFFINDASTDSTLEKLSSLIRQSIKKNIEVIDNKKRMGKSFALNNALKHVDSEVVIVSDADCFVLSNVLKVSLPYLSDPTVGAVTGREIILNSAQSWVTKTETSYDNLVQKIRLGESKIHSTIFFQGGFAAYKRKYLDQFDCETDDSGTALNIVQMNCRTLLVPEAVFYTVFPSRWKNKVIIKFRRATQLLRVWIKCLRLESRKKLLLPKRILFPEVFLYVVNPTLFIALILTFSLFFLEQPISLLVISAALLFIILIPKGRTLFVETIQANVILFASLVALVLRKKFDTWKTTEETRSFLSQEVLKEKNLI
jgi:cellulose synthase/poly-beta-1,6-N-acetylglucosamine synthase-like glycosyltransferase